MIIKYAIALIVVILLAAAFAWAFLPARYLPGNRARHLRIRLHLRLHPGKGFAHIASIWLRWGRLAMLRRSSRNRPALPLRYRLADPREHSVLLGRAHYRHRLNVPLEEHLLVMSPPRMLKTAFLADVILRYPGPVLATTTKPDVYALTAAVRSQQGPVHVFNPQRIGGVPSTFCWSPVEGCQDPATAIRRADAFAFAVSHKGVEDGSFWSAKASDYLRGYFHAAALAQYDLRAVAAWVSGADPEIPERILTAAGAHQWAHTLAELQLAEGERVGLSARVGKGDFEGALGDRSRLADELVQPWLGDHAVPLGIHVDTVPGAGRLPVEAHLEPDRVGAPGRSHDHVQVAGMEAAGDLAAPGVQRDRLFAHRPVAGQGPLVEPQLRRRGILLRPARPGAARRGEVLGALVPGVVFR